MTVQIEKVSYYRKRLNKLFVSVDGCFNDVPFDAILTFNRATGDKFIQWFQLVPKNEEQDKITKELYQKFGRVIPKKGYAETHMHMLSQEDISHIILSVDSIGWDNLKR
ncbi:hypothetical protein P8881_19560 [Bacillus haynesii]|uniref:hypothetical protein n=1 Tax=Bacillus haynesii TaxID=1925021 RepID=UPI002282C187|nr:hypothetical protein [Bacillus haynesii]MCY8737534.1 hypothetical protein [Bacillus haynesii]MEC0709724.1 hypothetical protein [Bacillus haynesii]MEC0736897.1 hypothetical protein [Bacillus haynesii]